MAVEKICRQVLRITALIVALSVTGGLKISAPNLVQDPLRPAVIQKSDLIYPLLLKPDKRSGVKGLESNPSTEPTYSLREGLKLGLEVQRTAKPLPTFLFIIQENHLRSPPLFVD